MSRKSAKWLLLFVVLLFADKQMFAQGSAAMAPVNHAKWDYNLKRTANNDYQLIFHLELDRGWHVRVRNEGNDTFMQVPSFTFTKNDDLQLKGEIKAKGIIEPLKIDSTRIIDVYGYKVLYIQELAAKPGTKVSGKYTYQLCSDRTKVCLPVKTEKFSFIMK